MLIGDVNRRELDLNRRVARKSPYRNVLRSFFRDGRVLLDIHSFPPKTTMKYDHSEVAVGTNRYQIEDYVKELTDYIYARDIFTFSVGGLVTDIITEAKGYGVEAYLLEFNEELPSSYRYRIVDVICDYFGG